MHRNLENICRVCLNSGSRNIFEKSNNSQYPILSATENVSSFDRLLEKLRYVTMLKIDENENLPKCICDSCIIQLNVAYNLKKAAIQSDIKLRQYVIEYGVNVTSYTTCINTVAIVRPPGILMAADNSSTSPSITTTTTSAIITTEKQTSTSTSTSTCDHPSEVMNDRPAERPQFAVMPMIIKEEPIDYEVLSDITVETNTESYEENGSNETRPSMVTTMPIIARQKEKRTPPLAPSLMVAVNGNSLLASSTTSDVDYINAYITPSSSSDESPSESTSPIATSAPSTAIGNKASSPSNSPSSSRTTRAAQNGKATPKKQTQKEKTVRSPPKSPRKSPDVPLELRRLQISLRKIPEIYEIQAARTLRASTGKTEVKPNTSVAANTPEREKTKTKRHTPYEAKQVDGKSQRGRTYRNTLSPIAILQSASSKAMRQRTNASPLAKKLRTRPSL